MKRKKVYDNQLNWMALWILVTIIFVSTAESRAQHYSQHEIDSANNAKAVFKMMEDDIREHKLHKDNKDSAWINNFNGHVVWDSRLKSKEGKSITITDTITGKYFVLDSTHTSITAYNKTKKVLWKINPRKDYPISEYRHKNPVITYFQIWKLDKDSTKKVISIRYSNSQHGLIEIDTGKFNWEGQD